MQKIKNNYKKTRTIKKKTHPDLNKNIISYNRNTFLYPNIYFRKSKNYLRILKVFGPSSANGSIRLKQAQWRVT